MNKVQDIRRVRTEQEKADAFAVRQQVFVVEQNVPPSLEIDEHDRAGASAIHFVAYRDDKPVGASRLRFYDPQTGKVERVAVMESERGTGLGRELMLAMEQTAREEGLTQLKLNAQCHAQRFYEKLGYQPVGDVFEEAGIDHISMVKKLQD
ncbi:GNAT family N-acetyltransferase [Brevibacillus humidisoli]|uniref:GNAT family N-acetyltransferase n=1 Tax=Brevibacillus humidisoli TaxID=2895522 RepID=UPI001E589E01|nr:GNAT family N-acetyltransferase [Brevibacillus humidisoli]UFJ41704.1 GNAT family N-acetyltransferase [Brevibacillus humidisoli]